MCIWNVAEGDRKCDMCTYRGGCEERERVISIEEVASVYVEAMSEILGRDVLEKCREHMLVWARDMVFYQLVVDGFSVSEIGRQTGFNHSTVIHAKNVIDGMLSVPVAFRSEMFLWEKFQKAIEECGKKLRNGGGSR